MIRRFNYTKRQRIEKQNIDIVHDAEDSSDSGFSATLDLNDMDLPPDAQIVIEAKRERSSRRFHWGTVASPLPPQDSRLTDLPPNPSFRVMVVAADGSGRLLALADHLKARRAGGTDSLLWLEEKDLGKEVWRLDFGEQGNPTMFVNENISGISEAVRQDDAFRSLVIPEALRAILTRALIIDDCDPDDDAGPWNEWLDFVHEFYENNIPVASDDEREEANERRDWIDEAVDAFAKQRFPASDQYSKTWRQ